MKLDIWRNRVLARQMIKRSPYFGLGWDLFDASFSWKEWSKRTVLSLVVLLVGVYPVAWLVAKFFEEGRFWLAGGIALMGALVVNKAASKFWFKTQGLNEEPK
jgi:hypothetical protein